MLQELGVLIVLLVIVPVERERPGSSGGADCAPVRLSRLSRHHAPEDCKFSSRQRCRTRRTRTRRVGAIPLVVSGLATAKTGDVLQGPARGASLGAEDRGRARSGAGQVGTGRERFLGDEAGRKTLKGAFSRKLVSKASICERAA